MNLSSVTMPVPGENLVLVSHALCPYVQRAAIALHEKGVAFERIDIDLSNKPAWFLALNPLGKTPVLLVPRNGRFETVFESAVICDFLDDTIEPRLHPADALERARHRAWIEVASATLNQIWQYYTAPDAAALKQRAQELVERLAQIERALGTGPWFAGEHFSLVDAAFAPVFRYVEVFETFHATGILRPGTRVARWAAALAARASVQAAVGASYAGGLRRFVEAQRGELGRLSQRQGRSGAVTAARSDPPSVTATPSMPRHDIHGPIHKALRLQMTTALHRLGALDVDDDGDLDSTLGALDEMLAVCRLHLAHESRHVHPVLDAAAPGSIDQAEHDHQAHRRELDVLAGDLRALRSAARHDRDRLARLLYRDVGRFVADNLLHMAHEEKTHNALLWAHLDDAALRELESRIVADTEPAQMQTVLAHMLPALNHGERTALLSGMQSGMPAEAFVAVLDLARRVLGTRAWAALARALGLPPEPGLITA